MAGLLLVTVKDVALAEVQMIGDLKVAEVEAELGPVAEDLEVQGHAPRGDLILAQTEVDLRLDLQVGIVAFAEPGEVQ